MTAQEKVKAESATAVHKNIFVALAFAQAEMGPLIKGAENPHFRSKYADLADVVDAVREPFAHHGLCYYHSTVKDEEGQYMRTTLCHGESGTDIHCDVPLIVQKNDMQAYKSATTYAKRIGLESVSGLAPEDDDGNDAAKNPPPPRQQAPRGPSQDAINAAADSLTNADSLDQLKAIWTDLTKAIQSAAAVIEAKNTRKAELEAAPTPPADDTGDEIPY